MIVLFLGLVVLFLGPIILLEVFGHRYTDKDL